MQVLVALVLRESFMADPPARTGTGWLSDALRLEQPRIDELVGGLERASLVRRVSDARQIGLIQYELAEEVDEDASEGELPIAVTDLGLQAVERWFSRTRLHFVGWPPERPDVDDAVGWQAEGLCEAERITDY